MEKNFYGMKLLIDQVSFMMGILMELAFIRGKFVFQGDSIPYLCPTWVELFILYTNSVELSGKSLSSGSVCKSALVARAFSQHPDSTGHHSSARNSINSFSKASWYIHGQILTSMKRAFLSPASSLPVFSGSLFSWTWNSFLPHPFQPTLALPCNSFYCWLHSCPIHHR